VALLFPLEETNNFTDFFFFSQHQFMSAMMAAGSEQVVIRASAPALTDGLSDCVVDIAFLLLVAGACLLYSKFQRASAVTGSPKQRHRDPDDQMSTTDGGSESGATPASTPRTTSGNGAAAPLRPRQASDSGRWEALHTKPTIGDIGRRLTHLLIEADSVDRILRLVFTDGEHMTDAHLATAIHRLARLDRRARTDIHTPAPRCDMAFRKLLTLIKAQAESDGFAPQGLANVIAALAALQVPSADCESLMAPLMAGVQAKANNCTPHALASIVYAVATMDVKTAPVELLRHWCLKTLSGCRPADLSNIAIGFVKLGVSDSEFLESIAEACTSSIAKFRHGDLSNVARAFGMAQYKHDALLAAFVASVLPVASRMSCGCLSTVAWCFARVQVRDCELLQAVASGCVGKIERIRGDELADALWACAEETWGYLRIGQGWPRTGRE